MAYLTSLKMFSDFTRISLLITTEKEMEKKDCIKNKITNNPGIMCKDVCHYICLMNEVNIIET